MTLAATPRPARCRALSSLLVLATAALAAGCGGDSTGPSDQPPPGENPPPAVAAVTVTPDSAALTPGDTVRLAATAKDAGGTALADRQITWTSSDTTIATVSTSGLVTARAEGAATVTATAEGQHGDATITVNPTPVGSVVIASARDTVVVDDTLRLTAAVLDAEGDTLADRPVTWTSSDTLVATVDADGLVTVHEPGTVTITAASDTAQATTELHAVLRFSQLFAGDPFSCGLTTTGAAYCWGYNGDGNLGTGTMTDSALPARVAGGLTFTQLTVGGGHACGLTDARVAYCWGYNGEGELGNNSTTSSPVPVPVAGPFTFTQLSAGGRHTCGLTDAGAAYCWGDNRSGALGDGSATDRLTPVAVDGGLTFKTIAAGTFATCAIATDGAAYCWGNDGFGQLGTNSIADSSMTPVAVDGGFTFTRIAISSANACGVTDAGTAYCWGNNSSGQLGTGNTTAAGTPTPVTGGLTFTQLDAGESLATCGVATTGTAYCWGSNLYGELGDNTTTGHSAPAAVVGDLIFARVSVGNNHSCGVTTDGIAYCWGFNSSGELGDGTMTERLVPTMVGGQQ